MAHTKYTGKSAGTTVTVAAGNIPTGWRKITIEERGKPIADMIDTTVAGDSAYAFTADPLGGKSATSATVSIEGFLSVTDHQDTGILATALGTTGTVIVTTATGGDLYTLTSPYYQAFTTSAEFAGVVPYTATFELKNSTGAWTTEGA